MVHWLFIRYQSKYLNIFVILQIITPWKCHHWLIKLCLAAWLELFSSKHFKLKYSVFFKLVLFFVTTYFKQNILYKLYLEVHVVFYEKRPLDLPWKKKKVLGRGWRRQTTVMVYYT